MLSTLFAGARLEHRPMNEAIWNASTDPEELLLILRQIKAPTSKLGRRKLRLYACGVCRLWWDSLNPESRKVIEITEQYSDGLASRSEFGRAQRMSTYDFGHPSPSTSSEHLLNRHTVDGAMNWLTSSAAIAGACVGQHLLAVARMQSQTKLARESRRQLAVIREVFGNPFNVPQFDSDWLRWNKGAIPKLASQIYAERRFGELANLAQCLESAGCRDSAILDHCISTEAHVLGCWLLDAILGRHWSKRKLRAAC